MGRIIEKGAILFFILIFISFLVNHGEISFDGVDWFAKTAKEAVNSDQGQKIISEVKDISNDIGKDLLDGIKVRVKKKDDDPSSYDLQKCKLIRVVDGDTIVVSSNDEEIKVRLIGVDTPESVHTNAEVNNEYGEMASTYLKNLLSETHEVYLQYDAELEDKYGRTLAYIWLKEDIDIENIQDISSYMLNGILLRNGYAVNKEFPPNTAYTDVFSVLRQDAEDTKAGLWIYDGFQRLAYE